MLTSAWILRDFGNRSDDGDDRIPGDTTDGPTVGIRMMKKMSVSVLYSSELKVYWQRMQCLNDVFAITSGLSILCAQMY